jgi:DNA modification methylase
MILQMDSLEFLKTQADYSADIIYCDPPYALGSELMVRADGMVDYRKAVDFMNKWEMPTGDYWNAWFKEAFRVLKYGGYCIMFSIDRQASIFQYYSLLSGLQQRQSIYWAFLSNFPKSADLSKAIDKNAGVEREVVSNINTHDIRNNALMEASDGDISKDVSTMQYNYTVPATPLAKKYEGYKYSICSLKQIIETVMIFQKEYLTGSCLHDVLAMEAGNDKIACGALDIDGNRVPTSDSYNINRERVKINTYSGTWNRVEQSMHTNGRFPAQLFIDDGMADILDKQSGIFKSSSNPRYNNKNKTTGANNGVPCYGSYGDIISGGHDDVGGASKIFHRCNYEAGDYDLLNYFPKVSKCERNSGCEMIEPKENVSMTMGIRSTDEAIIYAGRNPENFTRVFHNNHPSLKPIKLNERILNLFKSPNEQRILYPFAGAGSEIIAGINVGYSNWDGCELNADYVAIANARIKHWTGVDRSNNGSSVVNNASNETLNTGMVQGSLFDNI